LQPGIRLLASRLVENLQARPAGGFGAGIAVSASRSISSVCRNRRYAERDADAGGRKKISPPD